MTDEHFAAIEASLEFVDKAMKKCDQPTVSVEYTCKYIKIDLLVAKTQLLAVLTDTMREDATKTVNKGLNLFRESEYYK